MILREFVILAAAAAAAAQPVSFTKQIAPILAMNCHLCHGANPESKAGGLSTRTWTDLMSGGNLGPVIVAGDPERSPLYQFVSGARGEPHRMPLGGPPLDPSQVEAIRRWIAEGAGVDQDDSKPYRLTLPSVRVDRTRPTNLRARIPATAYISLIVTDSRDSVLYLDGGAVRPDRGVAAIGKTGEWIAWNLRRAPGWPSRVRVSLVITHSQSDPLGAVLTDGRDKATLAGQP